MSDLQLDAKGDLVATRAAFKPFVDDVLVQLAQLQIRALLGGPLPPPPKLTGRQRTRLLWRRKGRR